MLVSLSKAQKKPERKNDLGEEDGKLGEFTTMGHPGRDINRQN